MIGLGYVLGIATAIIFAFISMYIGLLLGRLRNDYHPDCVSYKQLADRCVGPKFENALEFLTCINWFITMALYILTAVESFQSGFKTTFCGYYWGLLCVVILTPFMLCENMKSIEWFATVSDLCAIIIIVLVLALLSTQGPDQPSDHQHNMWPPHESYLDAYNPISSFIFAYQGQSIFLEVMAEMSQPRDWPKSVYLSHGIMAISYSITAFVGYYYKGNDVPAFLPSALKDGPGKTAINLLVAYHVLVAYIMNSIPLTAMLKRRYMQGDKTPWYKHFALSWMLLLGAWLLTNLIPFFSDLVSIIGALCGSPIMLGLPPLFFYYSVKQRGQQMSWADYLICGFLFWFVFPFTLTSGLAAAFKSLIKNWEENGPPFTCIRSPT